MLYTQANLACNVILDTEPYVIEKAVMVKLLAWPACGSADTFFTKHILKDESCSSSILDGKLIVIYQNLTEQFFIKAFYKIN
jgi:hypothetical protein